MTAIVIDPLITVIAYLKTDAALSALVGTRIAIRHQYGNGWSNTQAGLVVQLDGGLPELYVQDQRVRLQLMAFAPTYAETLQIYRAVQGISRAFQRSEVTTTLGTALMRYFLMETQPTNLYDEAVDLPFTLFFMRAAVDERDLNP